MRSRSRPWIHAALADVPDVIDDATERTRVVHALADRNWREGTGGPFAALVAESGSGRIVSVGVNLRHYCWNLVKAGLWFSDECIRGSWMERVGALPDRAELCIGRCA